MIRDSWFKCDPMAFIDGFESLETPQECALYAAVVFRIYASGGPISFNPASLGAIVHMPANHARRIINGLIGKGKLMDRDGRLSNPRADEELSRRQELSGKRSDAGKQGGRPSKKTTGPQADRQVTSTLSQADLEVTSQGPDAETAENGALEKPNASPRAREKKEKIRENPPTPQDGGEGLSGQMPGPEEPLSDADRAELRRQVADVADRSVPPEGLVADLTGEVMRLAKMTAPPVDLVLIDTWLGWGAERGLILDVVTRLSATARSPIRGLRYFSSEIRRQLDAKVSSVDAEIAYFRRIAAERGVG